MINAQYPWCCLPLYDMLPGFQFYSYFVSVYVCVCQWISIYYGQTWFQRPSVYSSHSMPTFNIVSFNSAAIHLIMNYATNVIVMILCTHNSRECCWLLLLTFAGRWPPDVQEASRSCHSQWQDYLKLTDYCCSTADLAMAGVANLMTADECYRIGAF